MPENQNIEFKSSWHNESESVKQELTGTALNEFLLKRAGQTWDDVVEPRSNFSDIDQRTIKIFLRKAEEAGRLPEIDGLSTPEGITLDKLTKPHSSFPRNPIIAEACFRGGFIDAWGSGIAH